MRFNIGTGIGTINQYIKIMLNTVNNFGEFIEVETVLAKGTGYKALVMKYVDGKFRTSVPANSLGHARRIASNIIRYNQA
jgi:hypothetical protein